VFFFLQFKDTVIQDIYVYVHYITWLQELHDLKSNSLHSDHLPHENIGLGNLFQLKKGIKLNYITS